MKIKNVGGTTYLLSKIRDGKDVLLKPEQEIVLYDEDIEKHEYLLKLLKEGKVIKLSIEEPLETKYNIDVDASNNTKKIIEWIRAGDSMVSFFNGTILGNVTLESGVETELNIGITNADGVLDTFADDVEVTISSANDIQITPNTGTVINGILAVKVTANENGTITLTNNKNLNNLELTVTIA